MEIKNISDIAESNDMWQLSDAWKSVMMHFHGKAALRDPLRKKIRYDVEQDGHLFLRLSFVLIVKYCKVDLVLSL